METRESLEIVVSQSLVWTQTRSVASNSEEPDSETHSDTQNVCLLFAKIAAEAGLRCISITDYDTSEPLGKGLSFDVVRMGLSRVPWYHAAYDLRETAVKRICAGRVDNDASASQLRSLFHSILLELRILTNRQIRSHKNIVSCLAVGYQHFSYDTTFLLPFIAVDLTNQTTLANFDSYAPHSKGIQEAIDRRMSMSYTDRVNCLIDVARALKFLHKMGITHGDIKGDNVLVFYDDQKDLYLAKVTDFGCAHLNDEQAAHLPGGTQIWAAPEVKSLIPPDLIHKTDIYSYGLLVCSVILVDDLYGVFDLEGDRYQQRDRLDSLKVNGMLLEHAERALEGKKIPRHDPTNPSNIHKVLQCTLALDPSSRTLETIEDFMKYKMKNKKYGERLQEFEAPPSKIQRLDRIDDLALFLPDDAGGIPFPAAFFDCDWSVQTYIFANLYCEWNDDTRSAARRGQAAFQLCICYLNGFGTRPNRENASKFLCHAVSLKFRVAQHLFYRLQSALFGNFTPPRETVQWLIDGMSSNNGFTRHIAAQDLAIIDRERYLSVEKQLCHQNCVSSCIVAGIRLDFTNLNSLERSIARLPELHAKILVGDRQDTLLHRAVAYGSVKNVLLFLCKLEIDVNVHNALGETPLIQACQLGNSEMVELLISKGAKYISDGREKTSPLHYLLRFHDADVDRMAQLLSRAEYPIDMNIDHSGTPLYWAIKRRALRGVCTGRARNNLLAVKALLSLGADINVINDPPSHLGTGVIEEIALLHNFELLEILLDAAVRSRVLKRQEPSTPRKLMRWILNAKTVTTLERILFIGTEVKVRLCKTINLGLKFESDVDNVESGEHALFYSVAKGNAETVSQVLETSCRAQINIPSGRHKLTPLQLAVSLSVEDVVEALLIAGADIDCTLGKLRETCLHLCSRKSGSVEIAALLMKHLKGSSDEKIHFLNKPRQDGRTPYHLAVYQGHFRLADWYTAMGADTGATLHIITWNFEVNRVLPREWILGDYHKSRTSGLIPRLAALQRPPRSYICNPVTVLGSLLPYKTEHTMSRLEALLNGRSRERPNFIVSPQFALSALHFAVAEFYELFSEYVARIGSDKPSLLYDAPLSLILQTFPSSQEVNHADKNGWTALHIAALNSNVQAVVLLLESGADPNTRTNSGYTSLDCADLAKRKWSRIHLNVLPPAFVERVAYLRKRTDAIVKIFNDRGATRSQPRGVLGRAISNFASREWGYYNYLDALET